MAHQIDTRLHERSGRAVTNFTATLPPEQSDLAQQATKDPYLSDFLGVTEPRLERDVERKLMDHVSGFLLELGQGFALLGRQVRLILGGDEFFCDLLFYHVRLRCYVVVELKGGAFKADYLGQLGVYIAAVDDLMARDGDAPTVGLLCRTKNSVVAEYALRSQTAPIGVAEWPPHHRLPAPRARRFLAQHRDAGGGALRSLDGGTSMTSWPTAQRAVNYGDVGCGRVIIMNSLDKYGSVRLGGRAGDVR